MSARGPAPRPPNRSAALNHREMPRSSIRTKHKLVAEIEANLIKRLRAHDGLSRVEIARQMQLAPSTASIYVDRLISEGFLLEGEKVDRRFGRRPILLKPNPRA